jgi:hypothetical protein
MKIWDMILRKDYFCFSSQRTCGTFTEFEIKENGRQIECGPRSTIYNSENNSYPYHEQILYGYLCHNWSRFYVNIYFYNIYL